MQRVSLILVAFATLVGCGYSEDQYGEDLSTAMCDNITACETDVVEAYVALGMDEATAQSTYDAAQEGACPTEEAEEETGESTDECDFDSKAAQECVDAVNAMSCDFWSTGTGWPEVCNTVCG